MFFLSKLKHSKAKSMGSKRLLASTSLSIDWQHRLNVWNEISSLKNDEDSEEVVSLSMKGMNKPIITKKGSLTPLSLSKMNEMKGDWMVAKFNGKLVDVTHPLKENGEVELFTFEDEEGKQTFWHSAAHVLGQALETKFGSQIFLTDGPPLDGLQAGFFYEMFLKDDITISQANFEEISKIIDKIIKEKQKFERREIDRETAKKLFSKNEFKLQIIEKIKENDSISVYKNGNFIDLCRGPHVTQTGKLSSFELLSCGASHWDENTLLQRIYGISFPKKKMMDEWIERREEGRKRDHRVIGREQGLFLFHDMSPGSAFLLPRGTYIYNRLCELMRVQYKKRGYMEVRSPLIYKKELWEKSGHWEMYKDDMFVISNNTDIPSKEEEGNDDVFALKPMNCPGHCLMYANSGSKSYRDLPIRYADFSPLHRNEATGALSGLTRCRRFSQDDGHIFCTQNQIQTEINNTLSFIHEIYGIFGFSFSLSLSTRPLKYVGDIESWDHAEDSLKISLDKLGVRWKTKEGDGAFYGPKIDIEVTDALKRNHQCATIQLDFQLPRRFNLKYKDNEGLLQTPVLIHRAILGSVERMMAILIEHTGGKWPFWLNPRQLLLVPVNNTHHSYAMDIYNRFREKNICIDLDDSNNTLQKRIRSGQLNKYSYILVVGDEEERKQVVNVRDQEGVIHGEKDANLFLEECLQLHNHHFNVKMN